MTDDDWLVQAKSAPSVTFAVSTPYTGEPSFASARVGWVDVVAVFAVGRHIFSCGIAFLLQFFAKNAICAVLIFFREKYSIIILFSPHFLCNLPSRESG